MTTKGKTEFYCAAYRWFKLSQVLCLSACHGRVAHLLTRGCETISALPCRRSAPVAGAVEVRRRCGRHRSLRSVCDEDGLRTR